MNGISAVVDTRLQQFEASHARSRSLPMLIASTAASLAGAVIAQELSARSTIITREPGKWIQACRMANLTVNGINETSF